MTRHMRSGTIVLALATVTLLGFGCTQQKIAATDSELVRYMPEVDIHAENGHHFLYYPHHEVYYSPQRDVYFWKGAGFWSVNPRLPKHFELDYASSVSVQLHTDKPYRVHAQIASMFPADNYPDMISAVPGS